MNYLVHIDFEDQATRRHYCFQSVSHGTWEVTEIPLPIPWPLDDIYAWLNSHTVRRHRVYASDISECVSNFIQVILGGSRVTSFTQSHSTEYSVSCVRTRATDMPQWTPISLTDLSPCGESAIVYTRTDRALGTNIKRHYLTLMPYSSYNKTAQVLNTRTLRLMRVVVLRLLRIGRDGTAYTLNNSQRRAYDLWATHMPSLAQYGVAIATELASRGEKNTSLAEFEACAGDGPKPPWVYWPKLQRSHRHYLQLRLCRDSFAKYMMTPARPNGLRRYLRDHGYSPVRNMSIVDMRQAAPCWYESFQGYNYDFGHLSDATENFIYPRRLEHVS